MYLKQLKIYTPHRLIREIDFRNGLNLIIDETKDQITGNDVGKTTTLKLIDFCLGTDRTKIYTDSETRKEYALVKEFLVDEQVCISLTLKQDLNDPESEEINIVRNFLTYKEGIRQINGEDYSNEPSFILKLSNLLFPDHKSTRPTFRQIIAHNIRYEELALNNTLDIVHVTANAAIYEPIHLFLMGVEMDSGAEKQKLIEKLKGEKEFKKRLEKHQTKTSYERSLSLTNDEIKKVEEQKNNLKIDPEYSDKLDSFSNLKFKISRLGSEKTNLNIRLDTINQAVKDLNNDTFDDTKVLESIYNQAQAQLGSVTKTFEELVDYHNKMIKEKVGFIAQEIPSLKGKIESVTSEIKSFTKQAEDLEKELSMSNSDKDIQKINEDLNTLYKNKGEFEGKIKQINESEESIEKIEEKLDKIETELFSKVFEDRVKEQVDKFNRYFSSISEELYGEKYALNYDFVEDKNGQKLYKFSTFNVKYPNMSTAKKQGEISSFEIAYILFAEAEGIPCLKFILNDKKELMHDNQLVKIKNLVEKYNIQFLSSMLRDKLPPELENEEFFTLVLSQDDKLFRIESFM